jgi:hypothetical protein
MTLVLRAAWLGVTGGLLAQAAAMALALGGQDAAPTTSWLAIIGLTATMAGTLMLGAARHGRLSRSGWLAVATVLVVLLVGFGAALLLPAETGSGPLWLGLPRRAAIVLLGVGLVPVLVLPVCYALDFPARRDDAE